ncbi:MAG: hypothetical protein ABH885_06235 [Candidatus Omnitrophota bacterium]
MMRKNDVKKGLMLILIGLFTVIDFAYPDDVLTWDDCVRRAKENNPDLISAGEKVMQAAFDRDIDLSAMLPQVDSDLGGTRSKAAGKSRATPIRSG